MLTRKAILGAAAALIVGLLLVSQSLSQPGQRGQAAGGAGPQGPQGPQFQGPQFDPAQMRQMMEQRMKEQLGTNDQEWKVLGPRVMKVQELGRPAGGGGRGGMMMFGGPGGRRGQQGAQPGGPGGPGGQAGAPQRELTAVEQAAEQLSTLLDNTAAAPEDIKKQLTALRAAREKAKQELAAAQQELRKIVTVRQEAQLVLMGMLD
jgi:hypothetical protein